MSYRQNGKFPLKGGDFFFITYPRFSKQEALKTDS